VYLTIAEKAYPRKLAFSYLDELSKEFNSSYGPKVEDARKPYAFVGFGTPAAGISYGISLTTATQTHSCRKLLDYTAIHGQQLPLAVVRASTDWTMIYKTWRGSWPRTWKNCYGEGTHLTVRCWHSDFLTRLVNIMICHTGMSHLSSSLRSESEKYRKAARNINVQAMIRQYAPIAAILFIVIILLWWRFSWALLGSLVLHKFVK
jgi:vesicle transport protein SEC22